MWKSPEVTTAPEAAWIVAAARKHNRIMRMGALRSGRTVEWDPLKGKANLTPEQAEYWSMEYGPNWRPLV
jgi:hypothetical protein